MGVFLFFLQYQVLAVIFLLIKTDVFRLRTTSLECLSIETLNKMLKLKSCCTFQGLQTQYDFMKAVHCPFSPFLHIFWVFIKLYFSCIQMSTRLVIVVFLYKFDGTTFNIYSREKWFWMPAHAETLQVRINTLKTA